MNYRAACLLAIAGLLLGSGCPPKPKIAMTKPFVRGYISTVPNPGQEKNARSVYLPGIRVHVKNARSGEDTKPVLTDLSGRFTIRDLPDGRYNVCWEGKGYVAGCDPTGFTISGRPVHVSDVRIQIDRQRGFPTVYGIVKLGDGKAARKLQPAVNVNAFATVALLDAGGSEMHRVHVNNFGEYVLPQVPGDREIALQATIEGETRRQPILPEANLKGAPSHDIDLTFRNRSPVIGALVPLDPADQRVRVPVPGETVKLKANVTDRDGDPVKVVWTADAGTLSATSGNEVKWTFPSTAGRYAVRAVAWDGKGGYDEAALSLRVDGLGVRFSGTVRGTDTPAVAGATVDVNGTTATTGSDGYFSLFAPDAQRFVLTIRAPGYAFVSRIYDGSQTGGTWTLLKATQVDVDPTQPIEVTEDRPPRNCPGRASDRVGWERFADALQNPQYQNGKSVVVGPFSKERGEIYLPKGRQRKEERGCGPGVTVRIPPNSIVDSGGTAAGGPVTVSLATVDLESPDQMPGDYTVVQPSGNTLVMQSYGAVFVSLSQGGTPLDLAGGATAKLTMPVDPSQLAAPGAIPPTIPLLFYDETNGVWKQDGTATLNGNVYEATVSHFSAINTDTLKVDQACVRVKSPALPGSYRIEVTVPQGGGTAPRVFDRQVDNAATTEHVIYNLPTDTNITLVPYDPATNTPYGIFIVNTGEKQNPTDPNLPAGPPYDACSTEVTLEPLTVPPVTGAFLEGLYSFEATNLTELEASAPSNPLLAQLDQAAQDYYDQTDPCNKRRTLAQFISVNDFASGQSRAVYANRTDLGFGRDMHCTQSGTNVACYVTNYGSEPAPDQDDANDALAGLSPFATVAMEFAPIETTCDDPGTPGNEEVLDGEHTMKFFTYSGAGDALLLKADLDGLGARPLPQLCMVCHGGAYPTGATTGAPTFDSLASVKLGSRFLPFDTAAFVFPNTDPNFSKANQQADIQGLNDKIKAAEPAGSSVREVIDEMYAGGLPQDENFFITGWSAEPLQQDLYRHVIARSCRTCHVTHPVSTLEFTQHSDFQSLLGAVESRVCVEGTMPHARRTHELFWTSIGPGQVAQLQTYGDHYAGTSGWVGDKCGQFTAGGTTPETFFTASVQPIFEGVGSGTSACTGCHVGNSPLGQLRLDAAYSYAQLVNVPSQMTGVTLDRVEPFQPNQSFLVLFIEGNPGSAGYAGSFAQMAPSGSPNAVSINTIRTWITNGASP